MSQGELIYGQVETNYVNGKPVYSITVRHTGLGKSRHLTGRDHSALLGRAYAVGDQWDHAWDRRLERDAAKQEIEDQKEEARQQTEDARSERQAFEDILVSAVEPNVDMGWRHFLGETKFEESPPVLRPMPKAASHPPEPTSPRSKPKLYEPQYGLLDRLIPSRRERVRREAAERLDNALAAHGVAMQSWRAQCSALTAEHERLCAAATRDNDEKQSLWQARKDRFDGEVNSRKGRLNELKAGYPEGDPESVIAFVDGVLATSKLPDSVVQDWELAYFADTKTLVLNYQLPAPDAVPRIKEVKFVASREEFTENYITDAQAAKIYDSALYQLVLRALWEIFTADKAEVIDAICLNGIVWHVSPTTGFDTQTCVLSVQVKREALLSVHLKAVDPKECFKRFKGIGSSKLVGLVAVAPLQTLSREDKRFVESRDVLHGIDEGVNLAAMDWQDFEHLIRELFQREFSTDGSEVKITQASRDGGVDAVVFDSDPIRGGKIVIQAKRYTGTVDVSAVRDLFGTVMSEGAIKGILVTTSNYGPDAFAFAAGKPLTLLNGGNLLHLLQRHGTRAHIDIKQAKLSLTASAAKR
jgi:restriction system protein